MLIKYVLRFAVLIFCSAVCITLKSQQLALPDCQEVQKLTFDRDLVLDYENRFLYEGQLDTLESLYCFAKRTNDLELEAICLFKYASEYHEIFDTGEKFLQSLRYLNDCIELSKEHNLLTPLFWAIEKKATVFTTKEMYDQASIYAKELIEIAKKINDPTRVAESYMIFGRLCREQKNYVEADSLLHIALEHLENEGSSIKVLSFVYLHLSSLRRLQKRYKESISFANQGRAYAKQISNSSSGVGSYLVMELIFNYLEIGDFDKVYNYLSLLKDDSRHRNWVNLQKYFIKGEVLEKSEQYEESLQQYKLAYNLATQESSERQILKVGEGMLSVYEKKNELAPDVLNLINDMTNAHKELAQKNALGNQFKETYLNLENEKKMSTLLELNLKNTKKLSYFLFGIVALMVIIARLIYRQKALQVSHALKMKQLNVELKKNNLDLKKSYEEVERNKDELTSELKQKLLLLTNHFNMVEELKSYLKSNEEIGTKIRDKITNILDIDRNNQIVKDINIKFLELNDTLITQLSSAFPNLTSNDLTLCLYLSMNLSTKEIAQIQYKTPESIKVARSRLRRKLSIGNSPIKLISFLNGYKTPLTIS